MRKVKQEVLTVDEIDLAIVSVCPSGWPRILNEERKSTVLELRPAFDDGWTLNLERVLPSKTSLELIVWNASCPSRTLRMVAGLAAPVHLLRRFIIFLLLRRPIVGTRRLLFLRRLVFALLRWLCLIL